MKLPVPLNSTPGIIFSFMSAVCLVGQAEVALGQKASVTNAVTIEDRAASQANSLAMLMQVVKQLEHYERQRT